MAQLLRFYASSTSVRGTRSGGTGLADERWKDEATQSWEEESQVNYKLNYTLQDEQNLLLLL